MKDDWAADPRIALRATPDFDLAAMDRGSTPGWAGKKKSAERLMAERGELLAELQERMYAEGRSGGRRAVLCVVQGLDTAGKGGVARHVMGMVDPQGVALRSFGPPSAEERSHHFLWRIHQALPPYGKIGLFDRSHYEDVLVARVDKLVPDEVWRARYDEINAFEKGLVDAGIVVLKFAMMVSYEEQGRRLMERLDRPDKRWKYSMSDLPTRSKWDAYQEAYADVFRLTSTEYAPWHVLPADKKWYPRLAITEILTRAMSGMGLRWPEPGYDVAEQRAGLAATMSTESLQASLDDTTELVDKANTTSLLVREEAARMSYGDTSEAAHAEAKNDLAAARRWFAADLALTVDQKRFLLDERQGADGG
ncbi:PPK2 family polyphosphate kinase [Tessaracoccus caeni]|uniref:PPK2 family polyphosphate kinase n=1 Tax=Tessaracoccus caeni TaxID=3031239 RepID=UPI0023DCD571|nr:PPK2 family polyphosphate kinase [Tessaracoccus caeni]MDF1487281.1 polyphosphate kinase 2 family protein [Tessaracoccus caeni]